MTGLLPKRSGVLTRGTMARLYRIDPARITDFVEFDLAIAFKLTILRCSPSGSAGDADIFGSQQYAPLLSLQVPDAARSLRARAGKYRKGALPGGGFPRIDHIHAQILEVPDVARRKRGSSGKRNARDLRIAHSLGEGRCPQALPAQFSQIGLQPYLAEACGNSGTQPGNGWALLARRITQYLPQLFFHAAPMSFGAALQSRVCRLGTLSSVSNSFRFEPRWTRRLL